MTTLHAAMVERAERLLAAVEGMTPGPWEWWTSNSVKRLSAIGDGDVMYSYPHTSGTDIAIREPDMRGITLLRNEAPALIRSLLQALEAERGWRPIESAPKDETILLFGAKKSPMVVGMLHSRDGWVIDTPSEWATMYPPTHWMPLPASPDVPTESKP